MMSLEEIRRRRHELRKKWIEVLRSDTFLQGQGALKQEDKEGKIHHCCMGVLLELLEVENKKCNVDAIYAFYINAPFLEEIEQGVLPISITKAIGMRDNSGMCNLPNGGYLCLTEENDDGTSFREIADIIEKHLEDETLFTD